MGNSSNPAHKAGVPRTGVYSIILASAFDATVADTAAAAATTLQPQA